MDKDLVHIYSWILAVRNEILSPAEMCMDLKAVIHSEVCQEEENKAYKQSWKMVKMILFAKQKQRHRDVENRHIGINGEG